MNPSYSALKDTHKSKAQEDDLEENEISLQQVKEDIRNKFTKELIEGIKYYHQTDGEFLSGGDYSIREKIKRYGKVLYTVKDTLFVNNAEGDPLVVVSYKDVDRIRELFWHFHGDEHNPVKKVYDLISREYYGLNINNIHPWIYMCPQCRNIIPWAKPIQTRDYRVKVIQEPWFAIFMFLIPWKDLVSEKGGYILFVMDIYSKFTFYKEMPYFDTDIIHNYISTLVHTYGVPILTKLHGEELSCKEVIDFLQNTYKTQVVDPKKYPEHFASETTHAPKKQKSWLTVEISNNPKSALSEVLKNAVYKQNFTPCNEKGMHIVRRTPANLFFRRVVKHVNWKTAPFKKKYTILRADLPSLIDLLPEDSMVSPTTPVPKNKKAKTEENEDLLNEIDPETKNLLTMYNPSDYKNTYLEINPEDSIKGKIVAVASPDSISKVPIPRSMLKSSSIINLANENNCPIAIPGASELWARGIDPSKMQLLPHKYWIIKPSPENPHAWELYNVDTKEISTVPQERIFKMKNKYQEENKHLIGFLYKKFNS
ncbi:hypothetical protein NEPAR06_0798 [Nematocida parisii]|uniref:uncharacterized protein n=1 Tax=Nematocida parisii (strain ERTm1 / ATCC PRA-289) TaxID=881290 RepID=UPI000264B7CB|nr:uncharacterized protein NEPG_02303 [Nematocida parisii ERTm1]EIJ92904.1 hypothetical protein NEPG_02303 [Nematocida parisii ERTm1]KAI5143990.1 hypothetical protein NEPAR07_0987 [Nematocida parisii]KAI5154016.1 hypothetical protein NEPAR06_0798 [Nematocida parisii]KAI5156876.1 hypothetical protein NEPAR05_0872 [Nematocida parisii]|eukprot:XP_013060130.1 hypothetical protein NEPG_02303 [Nematocida parisii ERTm1]